MLHTIVVSGRFLPSTGQHPVAEARTRAIEVFSSRVVLGLGGEGHYDSFCVALGESEWTKACDDFCYYLSELGLPFTAVAYGEQESTVILDNVRVAGAAASVSVRLEPGQRDRPSILSDE